jgi:hypothetical protein
MNSVTKNIKDQFVTSLMNYFKIEEDINLRAHIADLTQNIEPNQYREFFRRLSMSQFEYKMAYEKIALVVQSFEEEELKELFKDVKIRVKKLYDVMYELHKMIILDETSQTPAKERFLHVYFARLRHKDSNEPILDALDIEVVKNITKAWIFDHVSYDKSLFLERVEMEYKNAIVSQHRHTVKELSATLNPYLLESE